MFNNIGGKIKGLAKFATWVGIIVSVIGGLCLASISEELIFAGIAVAVAGSLLSWVGSFLLYAIGQIAENTDIIAGRRALDASDMVINQRTLVKPVDNFNVNLYCPECSAKISYPRQTFKSQDTFICSECGKSFKIDGFAKRLILENHK